MVDRGADWATPWPVESHGPLPVKARTVRLIWKVIRETGEQGLTPADSPPSELTLVPSSDRYRLSEHSIGCLDDPGVEPTPRNRSPRFTVEELSMKPSTRNLAKGKLTLLKGKAKEAAGRLTEDPDLEAEGTVDKAEGRIQQKIGQVQQVFGK